MRDRLIGTFQRKKQTRLVPLHTGTFDSGMRADILPSIEEVADTLSLVRF